MIDNLKNSFSTQDLYLATAIILSGHEPDSYFEIEYANGVFIKLVWNDKNGIPLDQIESGEIKFAVRDFQKIHRSLTIDILNRVKSFNNQKLEK